MVSSYKVQTPRHRSLSTKFIGVSRHARLPQTRHFRTAATMSWPSLKMSASTTRSSPTMRLIGERPQSISGCTLSITIDGNARAMRHQSTEIHIERKDKSDCSPDNAGTWLRDGDAFSRKSWLLLRISYAEK